jgi:hypothetical protein
MTNNAEDLNLLGEDTFQPAIGLAPISGGAWLGVSFGGGGKLNGYALWIP